MWLHQCYDTQDPVLKDGSKYGAMISAVKAVMQIMCKQCYLNLEADLRATSNREREREGQLGVSHINFEGNVVLKNGEVIDPSGRSYVPPYSEDQKREWGRAADGAKIASYGIKSAYYVTRLFLGV
jgi:hypothetical protein